MRTLQQNVELMKDEHAVQMEGVIVLTNMMSQHLRTAANTA